MAGFLRILLVEDSAPDAHLIAHALRREGFELDCRRVETRADFLSALDESWDVILADYSLPTFSALDALRIVNEKSRDIPVIVVTGTVGEEEAVECIKRGAYDYLLKDRLARLGAAIEHAMEQHKEKLAARLRADLADMLVHDLRTPLTSLLVGLESIDLLGDLNEHQKETFSISVSAGNGLLRMINDLLDISRMEYASLPLEIKPLEARTLIDQAIRQVAAIAQEKRLALEVEIADDLPVFAGDEDKISRVLVNLLSNAVKFTPTPGEIKVGVHFTPAFLLGENEKPGLIFSVCDSGLGLPADAVERVFDKFWQVSHGKKKMSSGLGLTFCKMVIESHGGCIWVDSEELRGSTFAFFLPQSR